MKPFFVTEKSERPAGEKGQCFYCKRKIGDVHKDECVLVRKLAIIKAEIELPYEVPNDFDKDSIEFHLTESSWCASNIIQELEKLDKKEGCLCNLAKFEVINPQASEPYLDED